MRLFNFSVNRSIKDCIFRLFGEGGSIRYHLVMGAGGAFVLKITSVILGVVTSLILARILGVAEYGEYAYVMAWVELLGIPATLGFHQLLVRNVAFYRAREEWGLLHGLLNYSNRIVLIVSITLIAIAAVAGWILFGEKGGDSIFFEFFIVLISLPFSALAQLHQGAMRGFQQIIYGLIPQLLIQPALFLAGVVSVFFLFRQYISAYLILILKVVAIIISFLISVYLLKKITKRIKRGVLQYNKKIWLNSAISFGIISGLQLIGTKIDIIMLGSMDDSSAVGVYKVVSQAAWFTTIILMTVNTVLAPHISTLWAANNTTALQRVVTRAARLTFVATLFMWLVFIVWGDWFLNLFGDEFTAGYKALVILVSTLTLCTVAASVGLLLMMTNHEKYTVWLFGGSTLCNIGLNAVLIPEYSFNGAAFATGTSVLLMNIGAIFMVIKLTKINPTIFKFQVQ